MNPATSLALIALAEPVLPGPKKVQADCNALDPDVAPLEISSETEAMATFRWGEATIAYTLVDQPIPATQISGPCERAWYWPPAAECLAQHRAHLIVALVDERRDRVAKALRLTRFVAALLPTSEALGLQWGGSRQVHEPAAFCEIAAKMTREDLPLHLWIDFQVEASEGNSLQLYTTGLDAFGRLELEVANYTGAPQDLVNHAYNLAHYLLERGAVIKDGETIGLPGEVQVTVRETTTFLEGDDNVLQIEFE
jgi:hypothetical protein